MSPTSFSSLENMIARSAPEEYSTDGLKFQILQEAEKQKSLRTSRWQLSGVVASFLFLFVFSGLYFRTDSEPSPPFVRWENRGSFGSSLSQLDLAGKDIGSWQHVEAMLKKRSQLQRVISPTISSPEAIEVL